MTPTQLPRLRAVDVRPVKQRGQPAILLRDPLNLTEKYAVLPQSLAPLLMLCDGTRDSSGLRASLMIRYGVRVNTDTVDRILHALDEALLLDNGRFSEAVARATEDFRSAPFRSPVSAGQSYPAGADELRTALQSYIDDVDALDGVPTAWRGLVSPHIDFARGGPVYAKVWKRTEDAVREADVVVIIGTDHSGSGGRVTLTRQHYATPYGTLPTAGDIIDRLAAAIGPETAFADELHHRGEHSIELAAVWLHHMRGGKPCELVPILCGSFARFVAGEADPGSDNTISALVEELGEVMGRQGTLAVASADLAHVGAAFGGSAVDMAGRARLRAADDQIIERTCEGDAEGFFHAIKSRGDRYNICGLPPIYLTLRALAPVSGQLVAYDRCPADERGTSLVTICGVALA